MLWPLIIVSFVAVLFVFGAVATATPIWKANIFVVKRAILAITAITIALIAGVTIDGVNKKEVLANESPHIHETEVVEGLAKENESNLLAPKPDSVGEKLLGVAEPENR